MWFITPLGDPPAPANLDAVNVWQTRNDDYTIVQYAMLYGLEPGLQSVGERSNLKKILRTRKIMMMHSNERRECCPHTLIDRKWKCYDNAVDVVIRLHDPTDPSTEVTAPPRSAHVQLGASHEL